MPVGFGEEVCRQWDKVRDSLEEMVRFGELMVELEDYVDNAYIFNGAGKIIAREPGMKRFLAVNCPHIGYKMAMRYRILAMKARESALRRKDRSPQGAVFALREVARSAVEGWDVSRRRRVVAALMEIVRELSAS